MAYASNAQPVGQPISLDGSGIAMPDFVPYSGPAITQLTNLGLSTGPSPWALAAVAQQQQQADLSKSNAAQSVASQTQQAEDNLAMTGGLSSGARERAQEGGMKDYIAAEQGVEGQKDQNLLQISENDQQNKLQQLGAAANLEQGQSTAMNAYNASIYQQQMQAWAAQQQANATQNAGKK